MTDAKTILDAGASIAEIRNVGEIPVAIVPQGYEMKGLEHFLSKPTRKRGIVKLDDAQSFVAYVGDHKDDSSRIYVKATQTAATFTCVLDHHDAKGAQWGEHRAIFSPQPTVEWRRWQERDRKRMGQLEFAEFLEENSAQIVEPDAVKMIELALEFQAKTDVEFVSAVKQHDGTVRFKYEESTEAHGKGDMEVPAEFKLGIVLFEGSEAYEVKARLRYRIEQKKLLFWYELVNPHLVVKDAFTNIRSFVEEQIDIEILNGEPATK